MRRIFQLSAWFLLLAITAASFVPPEYRPVTDAPHDLEHFAIFWLTGTAFALGYPDWRYLHAGALVAFAGVIEIAQLWAPGRHARLSDFTIDAAAACIGIAAVLIAAKLKGRPERTLGI
jgi:VanZ family protein